MLRLVKTYGRRNLTIVVQRPSGDLLCFKGDTVRLGTHKEFYRELNDENTWCASQCQRVLTTRRLMGAHGVQASHGRLKAAHVHSKVPAVRVSQPRSVRVSEAGVLRKPLVAPTGVSTGTRTFRPPVPQSPKPCSQAPPPPRGLPHWSIRGDLARGTHAQVVPKRDWLHEALHAGVARGGAAAVRVSALQRRPSGTSTPPLLAHSHAGRTITKNFQRPNSSW